MTFKGCNYSKIQSILIYSEILSLSNTFPVYILKIKSNYVFKLFLYIIFFMEISFNKFPTI